MPNVDLDLCHFAGAFTAIAAMLAVSACGSESEHRASTNRILVYSGRSEDLVAPLIEQFTTDTGIEVETRYAGSGEFAAQLLTEATVRLPMCSCPRTPAHWAPCPKAGLLAPDRRRDPAGGPGGSPADDGTGSACPARPASSSSTPTLAPDAAGHDRRDCSPRMAGPDRFAPSNASWQSFVTGLRVLRGEEAPSNGFARFKAQIRSAYRDTCRFATRSTPARSRSV